MRIVLQRVREARVFVAGDLVGEIKQGLLLLLGVTTEDTSEDRDWLLRKVTQLRIFEDEQGKMNRSLLDVDGDVLVVSQFTLHAQVKKGTRPSFTRAAAGTIAEPMYNDFVEQLSLCIQRPVATGVFGAHMQVELSNDGPVTLILDSKQRDF